MTIQEAITITRAFINNQGTKCMDKGTCSYYKDGKRCAIGALLTEDEAMLLPNNEIAQLIENEELPYDHPLYELPIPFLTELQIAHDSAYSDHFLKDFNSRIDQLSKRWTQQETNNA